MEVERHRRWREEVSFVSPSDGEAVFTEKVLDKINDPRGVLNDELKGKLREAIARHYVVRSLPTPDAYLDEIGRNPYFQPHPEPHHDPQTRTFYRLYEDWPAAPELPWPDFVEDVWRAKTKWRLIPDGFGTGDAGSLVVVRRIRDRQEFDGHRALRDPSVRDRDWWNVSAARGPMQLVKPTSGIEAVLERDGEALVAECHLIVRYPEELVGNWVTRWYYDPETETWSVYITTVFSLRSVYVIR
ncbi:MAG: hypothetical protein EA423_04055 [Phycisphaerales bacterium]|nr:MAG: hypothetical protein EA423_04055 [Phycisphaerales bacterium]